MLTLPMISAVSQLQEQLGKAEELHRYLSRRDVVDDFCVVLSVEEVAPLSNVLQAPVITIRLALVAALRQTQADFLVVEQQGGYFDGPSVLPLLTIIDFMNGSYEQQLSASVALYILIRRSQNWLNEQKLALLSLKHYKVRSAFGDFLVEEKTGHRARVKACEQHYGHPFAEMDFNLLRDFATGVEI